MPTMALILTANTLDISAGQECPVGRWTVGFDHASLVAAQRSRADGYDLRIEHAVRGTVGIVSITGLNTSSCKIGFIAVQNVSAATTDPNYRLVFGDLGATIPTYVSPDVDVPADATLTFSALPALALPNPGFPMELTPGFDIDEMPYPEHASPRFGLRNQNGRDMRTLTFNHISPEEWYELRAFVRALKGAGIFTPPAWLDATGYGYFVVDFRPTCTRGDFNAELELEKVHA